LHRLLSFWLGFWSRAGGAIVPDVRLGTGHPPRDYFFPAPCARRRFSAARSSPVGSLGAKSCGSNTWRSSTSVPPSNGARLSHSIASSFDFTCHSQKPAISSFVSVNGPSVTVRSSPENFTRPPLELGWSPSAASITPAFTSCSLYLPIFSRISRSGRTPASDSLLALTITMNRMLGSFLVWGGNTAVGTALELIRPSAGPPTQGPAALRQSPSWDRELD